MADKARAYLINVDARSRAPGQVPRNRTVQDTPKPDTRWIELQDTRRAPVRKASDIGEALGLSKADVNRIAQTATRSLSTARNEIDFRKGMMGFLLQRYPSELRAKVMDRALSYYREFSPSVKLTNGYKRNFVPQTAVTGRSLAPPTGLMRKAYGGNYSHKEERNGKMRYVYRKAKSSQDMGQAALAKRLRDKLKAMTKDNSGLKIEKLQPLIEKYGPEEVTTALQELGHISITAGLLFVGEHADMNKAVPPTPPMQQPGAAPTPGAPPTTAQPQTDGVSTTVGAEQSAGATGRTGTKPLEVGAKRIWGDRVLEKKPDGKWHVVGHKDDKGHDSAEPTGQNTGESGGSQHLTQMQAQQVIQALQQGAKATAEKKSKKSAKDKQKDA